jgi:hypothetical protein
MDAELPHPGRIRERSPPRVRTSADRGTVAQGEIAIDDWLDAAQATGRPVT